MSKPAPCCCPDGTRTYYDHHGEKCRVCGKYRPRPKQEPKA